MPEIELADDRLTGISVGPVAKPLEIKQSLLIDGGTHLHKAPKSYVNYKFSRRGSIAEGREAGKPNRPLPMTQAVKNVGSANQKERQDSDSSSQHDIPCFQPFRICNTLKHDLTPEENDELLGFLHQDRL